MNLKPQDVMVALKLCSYPASPAMSIVAADLDLSPSKFMEPPSASTVPASCMDRRCKTNPTFYRWEEFLVHGLKYAFPADQSEVIAACLLRTQPHRSRLKSRQAMNSCRVWPWPDGDTRSIALEPLYKTAPIGALRDPVLYEFLALVNAIRDERARAQDS
jgi:hypothetical protein